MKKYISIILSSILFAACVDTDLIPYGQTVEADWWKTKSDVAQIVTKAYSGMANAAVVNRLIVWGGFRSDELTLNSEVPATNNVKKELSQIKTMNINTDNSYCDWSSFYSVINYCNIVIDKASEVVELDPDYSEADCQLDIAQMKALRSLCYFYLVRAFRDVPYITEGYRNSSQPTDVPQTAPAVVLQACIEDLEEAALYIYDAQNFPLNNWRGRGYLNQDAVYALLADIHLWRASIYHSSNPAQARADYEACVQYSERVIDAKNNRHSSNVRPGQTQEENNDYPALASITDYYRELFIEQNAEESIFEIEFSTTNSAVRQMYYSFNGGSTHGYMKANGLFGTIGTTDDGNVFIQSYDTRRKFAYYSSTSEDSYDIRKMVTEQYDASDPSNSSYSWEGGLTSFNHNFIIYRMTDVMLMEAEALTQIAYMDGNSGVGGDDEENVGEDVENGDDNEEAEESEKPLDKAFKLVKAVNDRALYQGSGVKELANPSDAAGMTSLVLGERLRELCFEGKRWFDLLRYNYRENAKQGISTDYGKILADQTDYIENNSNMLTLMVRGGESSIRDKMKTEPYLYLPIYENDIKLNSALKQNPVYSSAGQFERN